MVTRGIILLIQWRSQRKVELLPTGTGQWGCPNCPENNSSSLSLWFNIKTSVDIPLIRIYHYYAKINDAQCKIFNMKSISFRVVLRFCYFQKWIQYYQSVRIIKFMFSVCLFVVYLLFCFFFVFVFCFLFLFFCFCFFALFCFVLICLVLKHQ